MRTAGGSLFRTAQLADFKARARAPGDGARTRARALCRGAGAPDQGRGRWNRGGSAVHRIGRARTGAGAPEKGAGRCAHAPGRQNREGGEPPGQVWVQRPPSGPVTPRADLTVNMTVNIQSTYSQHNSEHNSQHLPFLFIFNTLVRSSNKISLDNINCF